MPMLSNEQFTKYANWMYQRKQEQRIEEKRLANKKMFEPKWDFDDYDIRRTKRGYESYNIHTGESLFPAQTHEEAMYDLKCEFGRI